MTWEHPFNKKRRLERTAFNQATGYKIPINIIRKIFSYKDAMNYIMEKFKHFRGSNTDLRHMAKWLVNSKTNNMSIETKMRIISHYLSHDYQVIPNTVYLKHVNSTEDYYDLASYFNSRRGINKRFRDNFSNMYTDSTLAKFMNKNTSIRKKILIDMYNIHKIHHNRAKNKEAKLLEGHFKVFARIGNKDAMMKLVRYKINEEMNLPNVDKNRMTSLKKQKDSLKNLSVDNLRKILLN